MVYIGAITLAEGCDDDQEAVQRFNQEFDEDFLAFCEQELAKINNFFAEKLGEANRKFANLQNELNVNHPKKIHEHLAVEQKKSEENGLINLGAIFNPKGAVIKKRELKNDTRKLHAMKLAFSEFYLSLVLLQNYQNLNFTGFRKILKKHDKLFECDTGLRWRQAHVDVAPFYTNKGIGKLIEETESLFTNQLENGNRPKAMKRLRVPPLSQQPSPWITFKVGLFMGALAVLLSYIVLTGNYTN